MNSVLKTIVIVATLCIFALHSPAQPYATANKLSDDRVTVFCKSDDGYMWIGTKKGINRYNGTVYKQFTKDNDGLISNRILSLLPAGRDGSMYVGTDEGICLIKGGKVSEKSYETHGPVYQMDFYDYNTVLFAHGNGLSRLNLSDGRITPLYELVPDDYQKAGNTTVNFIRTQSGITLVYSTGDNQFLSALDRDFHFQQSISIPGNAMLTGMEYMHNGIIALGTTSGLYTMSEFSLQPQKYINSGFPDISKGKVIALEYDEKFGNIVSVIKDKGIYSVNIQDNLITRVWPDEDMTGVDECLFYTTAQDVWVSRDHIGFEMRSRTRDFYTTKISSIQPGEQIIGLVDAPENLIFAITDRRIFNVAPNEGGYRDFTPSDIKASERISQAFFDNNNSLLWVSMSSGRILLYSVNSYVGLDFIKEYDYPSLRYACLLSDGRLAAFTGNSIHLLSSHEGSELTHIEQNAIPHSISAICAVGSSIILCGPDSFYALTSAAALRPMLIDIPFPVSMASSPEGKIVVGTRKNGIYIYDITNMDRPALVANITNRDGLPGGSINNVIITDKSIWGTSENQVFRIPFSGGVTGGVTTFLKIPGLSEDFTTSSALCKQSEYVLMASKDRIISYKPRFTGNTGSQMGLDIVLVNSVVYDISDKGPLDETVLEHNQNQIVFYYSCLDLDRQNEPLYQYMLQGYDRDWEAPTNITRASFSSLRPGRYAFKVRRQSHDGTWAEEPYVFKFRIKPSPWAGLPAISIYLLLFTGLGYLAIRQYRNILKARRLVKKNEQERLLSLRIENERRDFFTNISHEYRTPLSLIYGPIRELADNGNLDEHSRKLVNIIFRNTERMKKLAEMNLDYSKRSADKDQLLIRRTDMASLVRSASEIFRYEINDRGLSLTLDIPDSLDVWTDREKLDVILVNLISNAVKYTPDGETITVCLNKTEDGRMVLSVKDTGIGISEEDRLAIFERFQRLEKDVHAKHPSGYGIGLNYVQHVVTLLGGEINVADNMPCGTVFTVTLPCGKNDFDASVIWDDDSLLEEETIHGLNSGKPGCQNILVVEDDMDMRTYITLLLSEKWSVSGAVNGEEALNRIRANVPDLVISDIMMPVRNGYELCRTIKEDPALCHIPVILLTAKTDDDSVTQGYSTGADAYVSKPFSPVHLKTVIQGLFENRSKLQAYLVAKIESGSDRAKKDNTLVNENDAMLALSGNDKNFLEKLEEITQKHLSDTTFGVEELSYEIGMSRTSLYSKVRGLLGLSIQEYISNHRLNSAMDMLKQSNLSVSEISEKVGFSTINSFSKAFKNKFGIPPSATRA